ncbi:hypothetical protein HYW21_02265 [Candidatus Woesearchaeota archaeon]|nr:hypothetical protein [Candidatus Woesearchaeota archaeon]
MDFVDALHRLEEDPVFKSWKQAHEQSYLIHGVLITDANAPWQFGYYDETQEKVTSFIVSEPMQQLPDDEVFKHPGDKIIALTPSKVKVSFDQAKAKALQVLQETYKNEPTLRQIYIIQHLPLGLVWNITLVTKGFYTINLKINAENGTLLSQKKISLFEFKH